MEPFGRIVGRLRRVTLPLALLAVLACKGPEAAQAPKAAARLTVHFLDQDAVVGLDRPMPGAWSFMDAGLWQSLDTAWTDQEGRAAVGRTAPHWVMLQDPEGRIHRVVLSDGDDALRSRETLDRDQADEQAEGLFIAWLWLNRIITGR